MNRSSMPLIMAKLENLEEMTHAIKTDVAVIQSRIETIRDHDERIKKVESFQANLKGKVAIIAGVISIIGGTIVAWIFKR